MLSAVFMGYHKQHLLFNHRRTLQPPAIAAHPDLQLFLSQQVSVRPQDTAALPCHQCLCLGPTSIGGLALLFWGFRGCMPPRPLSGECEVFDTILTWLPFAVVKEYLSYYLYTILKHQLDSGQGKKKIHSPKCSTRSTPIHIDFDHQTIQISLPCPHMFMQHSEICTRLLRIINSWPIHSVLLSARIIK